MNAIILCGGLSTRLKDIAKAIPKILLDIKGETVLDWQLKKIKQLGMDKVVLAAGHLYKVLREEVGDRRQGVDIVYAVEPERLGTGGAIKFAWDMMDNPQEPTWVFNGDILTSGDLSGMLNLLTPDAEGVIFGARVPDASDYGTLNFDENNHLLSFVEKTGQKAPAFINGGVYLFNPEAKKYFLNLGKSFSVEYDVFPKMKNLRAYPYSGEWVDIGVPERLKWARENWQF